MLVSACLGANNLEQAGAFYDKVFACIGMFRTIEVKGEIGFGHQAGISSVWVLTPFDGNAASHGNGSQLIFQTDNTSKVDDFYHTALANGGQDEGAPGPRNYREGYYGAYCRDLDGNKLHVFCIQE